LQAGLGILRRRWAFVLAGALIGVILSGIVALQTPEKYRAVSRLFVKVPPAENASPGTELDGVRLSGQLLASYAKVIDSQAALQLVRKDLDDKFTEKELKDKIDAVPVAATLLLDVRATDDDPDNAADIANAAAAGLSQVIGDLTGTSTSQVRATIIDRAEVPDEPLSKPVQGLWIGGLAGLVLGLVAGVAIDTLDRSIREPREAADAFETTFLGSVPRQRGLSAAPLSVLKPGSAAGESYRVLRTAIRFRDTGEPVRSILITSGAAGDGKSTIAANLAVSLAQDGARVILIDADLRRTRMDRIFRLPEGPGLSDVLLGKVTLDSALAPFGTGLRILRTGLAQVNPSEALGSTAMANLLEQTMQIADFVIVDAPPTLPVADPQVLSAICDATIIVARWGKTTLHAAEATRQSLANVGANVLGVVLNAEGGGPSANYYRHYSDKGSRRRRRGDVEMVPGGHHEPQHMAEAVLPK
jgi:capsular exopolysaccharide synthesis family protein